MVDALRRAHGMVTAAGVIVDVHPTAVPARLEVGDEPIGPLNAADAIARHAAADAAVAAALDGDLFEVTGRTDFDYYTYGDTVEELRDYIAANWRDTRIGNESVARARRVVDRCPESHRPRVVEHVQLTVLRVRRDRR